MCRHNESPQPFLLRELIAKANVGHPKTSICCDTDLLTYRFTGETGDLLCTLKANRSPGSEPVCSAASSRSLSWWWRLRPVGWSWSGDPDATLMTQTESVWFPGPSTRSPQQWQQTSNSSYDAALKCKHKVKFPSSGLELYLLFDNNAGCDG